jgi:hypothetical protein
MLADIQKALDGRLALFPGEKAWEGVPYTPKIGTPYIYSSVSGRVGETIGIGPGVPRFWRGAYQLMVAHPTGEGMVPAYETATSLLDHFPRGLTLVNGEASVIIERGHIPQSYRAGDWINVPVIIEWYCEENPQ